MNRNQISALQSVTNSESGRHQLGSFFREHRTTAGMTLESAAAALDLQESTELLAFETGIKAIPLDLIFALTNLYNIAPEDVLTLVYDLHHEQGNR